MDKNYYYVVYSMYHNGNEYTEGKVVYCEHPLLFGDPNPVIFWQPISKEIAEKRRDIWLGNET